MVEEIKTMRVSSVPDSLGSQNTCKKNEKRSLLDIIDSFLSSFSQSAPLEITVPTNVYIRTQLLCEYIEEQVDVQFGMDNFLMTLYFDFLKTCIQQYNPKKIYHEMNRSHGYEDSLIIYANDKVYEYRKKTGKNSILSITIGKRDAEKGQLLLDEMEDLYGQAPPLEKMIAILWVNFIEDYKMGNNQKALNQIIRLLKKQKKEEKE